MRPTLLAFALVATFACSRDSGPSPEFAAAQAKLETTLAATLDPSYTAGAFDAVEAAFRDVPDDAVDYGKAQAMADEIGQARQKARALKRERARTGGAPRPSSAARPKGKEARFNTGHWMAPSPSVPDPPHQNSELIKDTVKRNMKSWTDKHE